MSIKKPARWWRSLAVLAGVVPLGIGIVGWAAEPAENAPALATKCAASTDDVMPIDLPTALHLVNASNPTIALAQARVEEAYAVQRQAEVSWLPDLRGGPAYARHDGRIQNSTGIVFDTSKDNLFGGGGAYLSWDTTNLYFGPLIARQLTQAQAAARQAVTNDVQLDAALTYLELLRIYASLAINNDATARAEEMLRYARAGDDAKMGKPADLTRALNEVNIRRTERFDLQGQAGVASARLAQLLLLPPAVHLQPQDPPVVPIALIPPQTSVQEMVAAGLENRPELRESRFLEQAAQARLRQAKIAPFLPRVEVGYSAGTFGGGLNDSMSDFGGRGDGVAQAIWELRNLGAGNVAQARARAAQVSQAGYYLAEVQARVGAEVASAASLVQSRNAALASAQEAVKQSLETWRRLQTAAFGMAGGKREYEPLEALLAEQAIDQARTRYLTEVIEYNKSQFRLYWAMGQPPHCGLPEATAIAVEVPVVPPPYQPGGKLPLVMPMKEGQEK